MLDLTPLIAALAGFLLLIALVALYAHGSPQVRRVVAWTLGALSLLATGALAVWALLRGRSDPSTAREDAVRAAEQRERAKVDAATQRRDEHVRAADEALAAEKRTPRMERARQIVKRQKRDNT